MKTPSHLARTILASAVSSLALAAGSAQAGYYAYWLTQIGVNDAVSSAANWGAGSLLGVVDTGIVASNPSFAAGQVSASLSSCAAVSFVCKNGALDDNGHGSAVAAIAAGNQVAPFTVLWGNYITYAGNQISVAPNANIVAQKVLNAAGSAYTTDVANGIVKAANAGARVINLSLGFINTPDIITAINYAASKGSYTVWAGGNSSAPLLSGANSAGLTAAAVQRLLLVGSVGAFSNLSSFSNTPGTGTFVDTSGKKTSYAARWVMAPGEAILTNYAMAGPGWMGIWYGTSMSAPLVSGSLLLLQNAWPILRTNGTAANLLLATTTNLGAAGVDSTYGSGLPNLAAAFQPYGPLTITLANGQTVAVSSLTKAMLTGGALGNLSVVQSKLASYTSYDSYARNFAVNLSGLIATKSTAARVNALPTNVNTGVVRVKLANGAEGSFLESGPYNRAETLGVFGYNPEVGTGPRPAYAMLTSKAGTTTVFGYGQSALTSRYSYARALYGDDDLARLSSELGGSSLADIAQGGGMLAYGMRLSDKTRLAVSWTGTPSTPAAAYATGPLGPTETAHNLTVGLTHRFSPTFTGGVTVGFLHERNGLLGSAYDTGSALSMGNGNRTWNLSLSAGYRLDDQRSVLLEAATSYSRGNNAGGFFVGTTDITARSWGMSFLHKDAALKGDLLTLSVKQPMRVSSGQVGVLTSSVDEDGLPHYTTEWASLSPTGREIDYKFAYTAPVGKQQSFSLHATWQKDALNISGNNVAAVGVSLSRKF